MRDSKSLKILFLSGLASASNQLDLQKVNFLSRPTIVKSGPENQHRYQQPQRSSVRFYSGESLRQIDYSTF